MDLLVAAPLTIPIVGAALSTAVARRAALQRVVGVTSVLAVLACSAVLLAEVREHGVVVLEVGGWPAGVGITLVADLLAVLLLLVASIVLLAVLVYAIGHPSTTDLASFFHPAYLVLTAGIAFAFLSGDLFSLYVAFEVMLVASYVLIVLGSGVEQLRAGTTYVVTSLLASVLFVTAVAIVYAATGTVNLAQVGERMAEQPPALQLGIGMLLLVVFGVKAAMFPMFSWLPDSYPTAPVAITAVFAGLLTKVGVYAIIRTQTALIGDGSNATVILVLAGATMVTGVLGAIVQDDIKRILSFHIVSQVGYMLMGLGLFTVAGLAGAVFYIVHHILVKTALFLVGGIVEQAGRTAALRGLGGLAERTPLAAALFVLPALSLAGIPPFSGFVAKLGLVDAGLEAGQGTIVAVSLLVSLLTLFSMAKIWAGAFWGRPPDGAPAPTVATAQPVAMVLATAGLVAVTLAVAALAGPLFTLCREVAEQLLLVAVVGA